jgi:hypothetical protein
MQQWLTLPSTSGGVVMVRPDEISACRVSFYNPLKGMIVMKGGQEFEINLSPMAVTKLVRAASE